MLYTFAVLKPNENGKVMLVFQISRLKVTKPQVFNLLFL